MVKTLYLIKIICKQCVGFEFLPVVSSIVNSDARLSQELNTVVLQLCEKGALGYFGGRFVAYYHPLCFHPCVWHRVLPGKI